MKLVNIFSALLDVKNSMLDIKLQVVFVSNLIIYLVDIFEVEVVCPCFSIKQNFVILQNYGIYLLCHFCFALKNHSYSLFFFATCISIPLCLCFDWYLNLALVIISFPDLNGNTWKVKKLKYLGHA